MTEMESAVSAPEPKTRSSGALVLFIILGLLIPICLFGYHAVLWFMEQLAIISGSYAELDWAEPIGLALQAVLGTGIIAALWRLTKDDRFKPVYAGWLGAALISFPGLIF